MKLAYDIKGAAEALDMSVPFFRNQVLPEVRVVKRGSRTIIPATELQAWLDREAATLL